ncbi:MAG: hypothetical protein ICV83_09550 [Cytophagales bacterium]|nr:hypothetical protein [Cytophagales bacterium]
MKNAHFYRVGLNGERIWLDYLEVQALRKDLLLYLDENLGEAINIYMAPGAFNLDYWKYLTFSYAEEWAESDRYKPLIEEGCIAVLQGIILEMLCEPITHISRTWRRVHISEILPYVKNYHPDSERLLKARAILLEGMAFIANMAQEDLDANGMLKSFSFAPGANWIEQNIVKEYYNRMLNNYGS